MTVQVDFDASRTPSSGDFLSQLGKNLGQLGKSYGWCAPTSVSQAPSRAYVAGATFKEERSGQLSILSLFQVGFPKIVLADLILADHRLCLGPGHTISCHTSWLQPGIFGGAPQVKKCHRRITPPPAWTCTHSPAGLASLLDFSVLSFSCPECFRF